MPLFEPANQTPVFDILYQQYLARQKNTEDLLTVVGDNSSLEGNFESMEDVVAALAEQVPALTTVQATTSGTAWDFTDIPSWVTLIIAGIDQFSTNGTSNGRLQLGTASGFVTSGYTSATASLIDAGAVASDNGSAAFLFNTNVAAASVRSGVAVLVKLDASTNTWACGIWVGGSNNTRLNVGGGTVTLTDALTQIRFTTVSGDTGDGGKINLRIA